MTAEEASDIPAETAREKLLVGTSGYSFSDWIGPFYPPGTGKREMLSSYVQAFETVEVNYTYYRMPAARTMDGLARRSPPRFDFWIKANGQTTHEQQIETVGPFLEALEPLRRVNKLAGVLLQFPQSFHRTVANRRYLAELVERMSPTPLAVEFRHCSWEHPSVERSLAERNVALVVPDVPDIASLYHHPPAATSPVGYLRLHSRLADNWYAGAVERYDYDYSHEELRGILAAWQPVLDGQVDKVYAFFNNCHRGQAARNAESFRRLIGQIE